jgi:F-type H+-transporting ATPase subunit b
MRSALTFWLVGAFALAAAMQPSISMAKDEKEEAAAPHAKAAEHKDAAGGHGDDKPKDNTAFLGIKRHDLAIYTLIVFIGLFLVLGKFAWKPIMDGLQKREDFIVQARTDAETARSEAQKLLDDVKAQRAKANDEIAAILAQARKDSDAYRESEKARTAAELQAERERLRREIETARDQALQEIWAKTVGLATLVSSKALGRAVSDDDHSRLIEESLAEIGANVGFDKA